MQNATSYDPLAKLFHWTVFAAIAAQFVIGWIMPDIKRGMQPESLMNLHLSIGLIILALMTLRYAWRLVRGVPPAEACLPVWQRRAAELMHLALYLMVFAMTLSGWLFASMRGWAITLFGLLPVPHLVAQGSSFGHTVGAWHGPMSWALLALIGLHAGAALAHRFLFRDQVLQRMLPRFGGD
jgi:cytochrome b561